MGGVYDWEPVPLPLPVSYTHTHTQHLRRTLGVSYTHLNRNLSSKARHAPARPPAIPRIEFGPGCGKASDKLTTEEILNHGEVVPCLRRGGGALHSPPESLERRGPGHPGFLQAGPVAGLHGVGGAVHGAAVQVALGVRVAAVPDAARGPARGVTAASGPGRRRGRGQGGRRRLHGARGLGRGRRRRGQVVMGVQEAELGLPERVLVVLLLPPEVLGGFERGPAGAVAALAAARPGRQAAALCLHPGSRLRALLPSPVRRAGPSASPMLPPPPPPLLLEPSRGWAQLPT